jgi:hypothetical protein
LFPPLDAATIAGWSPDKDDVSMKNEQVEPIHKTLNRTACEEAD